MNVPSKRVSLFVVLVAAIFNGTILPQDHSNAECPRKRIYLANPMGFSLQQKKFLLPKLVEQLERLGLEVIEPWTYAEGKIDFTQEKWAFSAGQICLESVKSCDAIFAVVNGVPPDDGVMVELGYAMALGKEVFLFRDDFRRCPDSQEYPLNIMIFAGLPEHNWKDYYFMSVEEITLPEKMLSKWVSSN